MAQRFEGKTVLVTGGNSGMGFATAKRIVQEGGRVIITGRDAKTLEQAKKELGAKAEAIQSDVSKLKDIDALAATVKAKYGKIDGLFANAGVAKFGSIDAVTEQDFDELFDINVKGVFFTLQKIMPLLNSGGAVLVNASVVAQKGRADSAVYSSTKAAVRSMARTFAAGFVDQGIRVNAISPGPIDTPIWGREGGGIPKEAVAGTKAAIAQGNPMKRYGTVDELAGAAAFLLSSESSYVLGVDLLVDGGYVSL